MTVGMSNLDCCLIYLFMFHVPVTSTTTFTAKNSLDEQWTFEEESNTILECNNNPYTGFNEFLFNATRVFRCLGSTCTTLDTYQESFLFQNDTDKGIFTWNIYKIPIKFNQMVVSCFDGSEYLNNTITVKGYSATERQQHTLYILILVPVFILFILFILLFSCILCESCKQKREACRSQCSSILNIITRRFFESNSNRLNSSFGDSEL